MKYKPIVVSLKNIEKMFFITEFSYDGFKGVKGHQVQ